MRDDWQQKRQEWSAKSKYNSFNSYKGLTYLESHYNPIAKWWKKESDTIPAPIELSLDPGHLCNFKCQHCNAQRYLVHNPNEVPEDRKLMSEEHLRKIIDFCAEWGVRGVCIGGGGEPLMNKAVWNLPSYIKNKGMQSSFATNGSLINEKIAEEMMNCRWVGVSVDAGTKEVFNRVHGFADENLEKIENVKEIFEKMYGKTEENIKLFEKIQQSLNEKDENQNNNLFEKVIDGLKLLVKKKKETGSKIDIAYKFLIRPDNWQDIYNACKLAKEIGVRDFHARPADLQRKDFKNAMELNYNLDEIHRLFIRCHDLEDENFRVFTIMHKYDPEFKIMHTFCNCVSSPLMLQACSDGNVYVCADHRLEPRFKLCSHFPDPSEILKIWGTDQHRELLKLIKVDKECGRCTYGEYARQIEEMTMDSKEEDPMCIDFP
ncbi:MAG: radical SAM protein [Nanoarchaeota archaeon]|nr:radical SAM protein [Nanoarchaeota archaeon]MBU1028265.1 radical SAM protein [Nanoarchaeota archaeon]